MAGVNHNVQITEVLDFVHMEGRNPDVNNAEALPFVDMTSGDLMYFFDVVVTAPFVRTSTIFFVETLGLLKQAEVSTLKNPFLRNPVFAEISW